MTRTLLSLHRTLWPRSFKANPSQIFVLFFFGLYGIPLTLALSFGIATVAQEEGNLVLAGAVPALGVSAYWLISLLYTSPEGQVDASRVATLPVRASELIPGFLLIAFLQIRALLALICTVIIAAVVSPVLGAEVSAGWIVAWVISCVLSFVLAIVGGQAVAALADLLGNQSPRIRRLIIAIAIIAAVGLALWMSMASGDNAEVILTLAMKVLAWSPLAAPCNAVLLAASGRWLAALGMVVAFVALLALAVWAERAALESELRTFNSEADETTRTTQSGSILLPWAPKNRWGAIYSRAVCYWWRDKRLTPTLFLIPIFAIIFLVLSLNEHNTFQQYVGLFFIITIAASGGANDYGYDGPANWVHIAASVPGRTMVTARAAGVATIVFPPLLLYLVAIGAIHGLTSSFWLAVIIAITAAVAALGLGSALSVLNPYPTSRPGTNAFKDKSGLTGSATITGLVAMFALWIPLVPGATMMMIPLTTDYGNTTLINSPLFWAGVLLEVLVSALILFIGQRISAKRLDAHWPKIMQKVKNYL